MRDLYPRCEHGRVVEQGECHDCLRAENERLKAARLEHSSLCEGSVGLPCDLPSVCDPLRAEVERLTRERDEARALLQAATDNAFDAGAKAQGLEDSHRFVAMRKERDEARADYERARADFLRCAETQRAAFADAATDADLLRAENERLRGLIAQVEWVSGGYIMGPPSCPWCAYPVMEDGHAPDCPAFSARGEVRR